MEVWHRIKKQYDLPDIEVIEDPAVNELMRDYLRPYSSIIDKVLAAFPEPVYVFGGPPRDIMRHVLHGVELKPPSDLDLFIDRSKGPDRQTILVLDNELAIYKTTAADVALRKSPTVKEMINLGNIIKILNDRDVIVSKREASVLAVQAQCLAQLDLHYTEADLDDIVNDGAASLDREMTDGVLDCLTLWRSLLGLDPAPAVFQHRQHTIMGVVGPDTGNGLVFGPAVVYAINHNRLLWIDGIFSSSNTADIRRWQQFVAGKLPFSAQGADVFQMLKALAMTSKQP